MQDVAIVWFKRDLRLPDNESVYRALHSGKKILFIYVFEPLCINDSHYSKRHIDFIKQSIQDLNNTLCAYGTRVLTICSNLFVLFDELIKSFNITHVFSQQETGLNITFERDKQFSMYCRKNQISWIESVTNGVFRGRRNRINWVKDWETYMKSPMLPFQPIKEQFIATEEVNQLAKDLKRPSLDTERSLYFQYGGRTTGIKYRDSFFGGRYVNYARHISKPTKARMSCSRLSPYIAWGNFSVRELFQCSKMFRPKSTNKRAIDGFTTRLRWQAHFIQKFEMECSMETKSLNSGYTKMVKPVNKSFQTAWEQGQTGFPIIDACMRCLVSTGYLNFRMRAMVVSFYTHNLWQPWQNASSFLARQFLDFEPGIHFPQLQMQAGEIGINTIRIYSPVKNGLEHDPDATFIKKWVPELRQLPLAFIHEPYLMTYIDQQLHAFELGKDYPMPIIDIKKTRKHASDTIWDMKKDIDVQRDAYRILKKHVIVRTQTKS